MTQTLRAAALVGFALALGACDSTDLLGPDDVTGTYLLRTTSGLDRSATGGQLRLTPDGAVERRLTFVRSDGTEENVWLGRYRVRNEVLEIAFWPEGMTSGDLFYRAAAYRPGLVVLQYGHPADGPDIIEVYEKADPR